jgi:uncharacterized protein with GYD domain
MATFVSLITLTDQGIRDVKQSPERAEAFSALAETLGVTVKAVYYTIGAYDMVVIAEGEDQAVVASVLATAAFGNLRTQTMLAFSKDEMKAIVAKMG